MNSKDEQKTEDKDSINSTTIVNEPKEEQAINTQSACESSDIKKAAKPSKVVEVKPVPQENTEPLTISKLQSCLKHANLSDIVVCGDKEGSLVIGVSLRQGSFYLKTSKDNKDVKKISVEKLNEVFTNCKVDSSMIVSYSDDGIVKNATTATLIDKGFQIK